jgi:hypothetical protein
VKRKGDHREVGSEGSVEQTCESMDKKRIQGVSSGRAAHLPRSPYPSRVRSVDPTAVHGRRLSLPQEICSVSAAATEAVERWSDRRAEVSRGHIRPPTSVRLLRHSKAERRSNG